MIETNTGKVISIGLLGAAVIIGIKHRSEKSFWIGVGTLFLVSLSVNTYITSKNYPTTTKK